MSSDNDEDVIAEILDARAGRSALVSGAEYLEGRPDLRALLDAADLAWEAEQEPPPLPEDPVAAMLGLVPDPEIALDGKALAAARKRAGLSVSGLAAKMADRGWDVTSRDVFGWESNKNAPQVPAVINALASITGADPD